MPSPVNDERIAIPFSGGFYHLIADRRLTFFTADSVFGFNSILTAALEMGEGFCEVIILMIELDGDSLRTIARKLALLNVQLPCSSEIWLGLRHCGQRTQSRQ